MKNKLIQNARINNHIRIVPVGMELPDADEAWAERLWQHLCDDDLTRHAYRCRRAAYTISVWSDDSYAYLIQVVRTPYRSNGTIVYMSALSDEQIADFKAIAKFMHSNTSALVKPYDKLKELIDDTRTPIDEPDPSVVRRA